MAHACFHERKRVHYPAFEERSHTRAHTPKQGPSLPRPQHGLELPAKFLLFHHAFIYIHFPVLCEPPLSAERKIRRNCRHSSTSDHLSSRFSFSHTNGPRSLSQVKTGTHSAFGERSHTRAHTAKQGPFRMRVVSLPSERSARPQTSPGRVSERQTLPLLGLGRVCSRRTQKAFGTAMRLCVSLSRGVAAPLGCAVLLPLSVQRDLPFWKDLTRRSGRVTITRNSRTASRLTLVWEPRWAVK